MLNPYGKLESESLLKYLSGRGPINGPHNPVWMTHAEIVEKTINMNKLQSSTAKVIQHYSAKPGIAEKTSSEQAFAEWWLKYGGIKVPHLHYNGEIYLLNKKQWTEFSGEIIKDFSKKLSEAKTVNFGQLMGLSEAMNDII